MSAPAARRHSDTPDRPPGQPAHPLLYRVDQALAFLLTLCLIALIAIVFGNVVARDIAGRALTFSAEAAQWLFIAVIFLGLPRGHLIAGHVSVRILADRLTGHARTVCDLAANAVVAATTIALLTGSVTLISVMGGVDHALGLPVWVKFALIPASCAISLLMIALRDAGTPRPIWRGVAATAAGLLIYLVGGAGGAALSPLPTGAVLFALFGLFLLIGVPVAVAMLAAAFAASASGAALPAAAVVQTAVNGASGFLLLAIPFFVAAAALMNAGGLTQRLIDLAKALVGHFRGGLAQVNILSSGFYAGISGSSYAEATLGTKLLVPQMIRNGYPAGFACAVTAASATLPNVIPPSIALLILAAAGNLSVGSLWIAGIVPGIVMALALMAAVHWIALRREYGAGGARPEPGERRRTLVRALPVLVLAVLIVGGIRTGFVTPTEAGVLAVIYALFLGAIVYRTLKPAALWQSLRDAAQDAAQIGFLIGAAAPFAFILVTERIPQTVVAFAADLSLGPILALLLVNLVMLLFGMILDIGAAILILTPLLLPLMVALGIDPVHFGIIAVVNLMIGGLTPPVGMLALIAASVSGTPAAAVYRAMLPFFGALLLALLGITFVPALSLGLEWIVSNR